MTVRAFFYRETRGIRITVRPRYLGHQSLPDSGRYVFAYHVRIENVGTRAVTLLSRRWRIHDAVGEELEVVGDGVVGQQPTIQPGAVHEYSSFCVLQGPSGAMEGAYQMVYADGTGFDAIIPRFELETATSEER